MDIWDEEDVEFTGHLEKVSFRDAEFYIGGERISIKPNSVEFNEGHGEFLIGKDVGRVVNGEGVHNSAVHERTRKSRGVSVPLRTSHGMVGYLVEKQFYRVCQTASHVWVEESDDGEHFDTYRKKLHPTPR